MIDLQHLKRIMLLFLIVSNLPVIGKTQTFKVASGAIVTTVSDSRSVNFLDLNNDGWEDIYISNGLAGGQADLLYLNDGTGQMVAVTAREIVMASNPADGASFVDYNNDGHIDGVVSSWYGAEDLLYLNNGAGQLNYNAGAGIVVGSYAETASFGDYNNDGWLDLYITNSGGDRRNFLYKNLQNGKFEQITDHILVNDVKLSRGAVWGDFNNDGRQDLFVANEDNTANDIFLGKGNGDFEKMISGTIVNSPKSSMTGSWGDIDNDGDFDLFVGNSGYFAPQPNQLFLNTETGFVAANDDPVVVAERCTYGSAFSDFDNDGDLDLFVANGYCNTGLANQLYVNQGDGTFADSSQLLPFNFLYCSFGAAWGDVNNDGFPDLMIANCKNGDTDTEKSNTLLINQGNTNNWLDLQLQGIISNTSAIGAKVRVKAKINRVEIWQLRELRSQSGYAGQNSSVVHFGLGDAEQVDSLIIEWPSGIVQIKTAVAINHKLKIDEDITLNYHEYNPELAKVQFQVFPNPVALTDMDIDLLIKAPIPFPKTKVLLYDNFGRLLWEEGFDLEADLRQQKTIPLQGMALPSGIYHVVLQLGAYKKIERIVLQ